LQLRPLEYSLSHANLALQLNLKAGGLNSHQTETNLLLLMVCPMAGR